MGSATSKSARTAGSAVRKYPVRHPATSAPLPPRTRNLPSTPAPGPGPTTSRDQTINLDSSDLDLALNARLSQLGPVQPNPTFSGSSTFHQPPTSQFQPSASTPSQSLYPSSPASNPAVTLLAARSRLAEEAEVEFESIGRRGAKGRTFLDVTTLRQVLILRDEKGVAEGDIERQLGLREGVVRKLGRRGVVSFAGY